MYVSLDVLNDRQACFNFNSIPEVFSLGEFKLLTSKKLQLIKKLIHF